MHPPCLSSHIGCNSLAQNMPLPTPILTLPLDTFPGDVGFEHCYAEVLRVVQGKLHQPEEVRRSSFYAFSYYYDRAVDTGMIGECTPGPAEQECRKPCAYSPPHTQWKAGCDVQCLPQTLRLPLFFFTSQ